MQLRRNEPSLDTGPDRIRDRAKLLGLVLLVASAAVGLGVVAGGPRLPDAPPRLDQLSAVLSGSTLPVQPVSLVLIDLVWLMWAWIAGSLGLELLVEAAEAVARGAAWAGSLRRLADRVTLPLARRAVAAAFAVQILSRGVSLAAAQELTPAEASIVAEVSHPTPSPAGVAMPNTSPQPARGVHVVRAGDTLWSIAERWYGAGTAYRRLLDANVGRRMPDGQMFTARGVIQSGWELVIPQPSLAIEEVDGQRAYTVQAGDTLSGVAAATLGNAASWPELFELNAGAASPDGRHALTNPDVIWPGLRLRLPATDPVPVEAAQPVEAVEPPGSDFVAASSVASPAPPPGVEASVMRLDRPSAVLPTEEIEAPPLLRTLHVLEPINAEPTVSADSPAGATGADSGTLAADADVAVPAAPPAGELAVAPVAVGGLGLAALAGVVFGARRRRRLRPLPLEPESEVVVEGGFAEAQLAHAFVRGAQGMGFDPVTAVVDQVRRLLEEYELGQVGVVALRHGRSATTLTLAAGLAEQPILVDLAPVFAARLDADAEAWVSADQDVVLRLARVRKTRLLPPAEVLPQSPCLVPLGVLYDRQVYVATLNSLGHVLIASPAGHGADTILTSLVATLTARRSPEQLRVWMIAGPRAVAAPLCDLPHLARSIDPADDAALLLAADDLRAELDRRARDERGADLLVVLPELTSLGEQAASFELLARRAAGLGVHFVAATSCPQEAVRSLLLAHFGTRMVLRMQHEDESVALLGVADAAFLGGGGRLLLRLDGREPVELYGYQVSPEHLERLVRVMRSAYPSARVSAAPPEPASPPQPEDEPPLPEAAVPPASDVSAEDASTSGATAAAANVGVDTAGAPKSPPIQVTCFGGPRVVCAGQQVWPRRPAGEAKPWEFLLYLACQPAEGVSSEDALEALWPEDDEAPNPAHRFRQLRYRLRHQLAAVAGAPEHDGICMERGKLRLDPDIVASDAQEFLGLVHRARITPGPGAIPILERARELYVGDVLEGPDTRRYAWVIERDDSGVTLREHFRRLFLQASTRLAELYAESGDFRPARDLYRELTDIDPSDERLWCALFRVHADRGDRLALVREEHRLRTALRGLVDDADAGGGSELADPSRETLEEYQQLLASLQDRDRAAAAV